ncbi:hypothetical protein LXA43DRAFT_724380 [Ganoderma leucocontextum]|nr:hypothetical protein LXA43DRAFT_724380 [Ganoderma leucocontextum]
MAPPKRAPCQVCESAESKYTCSKCTVVYCSVPCYKQHKETYTCTQQPAEPSSKPTVLQHEVLVVPRIEGPAADTSASDSNISAERLRQSMRTLASLRWPYVPEESAFPDPLKRDDPKPIQIPQYEAIAMSPPIRRIIGSNPQLRETLLSIDKLRGEDRELAIQEALGVGGSRNHTLATVGAASEEDRNALRELAEAVESAVRGEKRDMLGLDWANA